MTDETEPVPPPETSTPAVDESADAVVDWGAIAQGAIVGLGVLAAASLVSAVLRHNLDDYNQSGWRYPLFVVVLVGYFVGGFVAGRRAPSGALTNGALAGALAFALWVPVRVLIWVARDENRALFTGHAPVFKPGQIFGHLVIASALGMLGGIIGSRVVVRRVE